MTKIIRNSGSLARSGGKDGNHNGFRWMDADAYLFDIDGTLLVSRDRVHRNALHQAMREVYGVDTTIDGIPYHGKTDLGILRVALELQGVLPETFEAGLPQALAVVCREVTVRAHELAPEVCPSIREVIAQLQRAGKLLGVASGNLESVGWHKIKAAGLDGVFSFGSFSDRHELRSQVFCRAVEQVRQRLGEHSTTCIIGDTPEDIRAARVAGAQIIAVGTGVYPREELAELRPDACIQSCTELLDWPSGGH
jgi:phosphoglycolate phosphatase-like HAD superfamily hydrolase